MYSSIASVQSKISQLLDSHIDILGLQRMNSNYFTDPSTLHFHQQVKIFYNKIPFNND